MAVTLVVGVIVVAVLIALARDGNKPGGALPASSSASIGSLSQSDTRAEKRYGIEFLPRRESKESIEQFCARRRKLAIEWAKQVLENKDQYVILDTETTGLGEKDVIIQLAIIDLDGNPIINTLIKPTLRKRISAESTAIHGIKIGDLANAPTLLEIADDLDEATRDKIVIIYNAEYDDNLLFQTMDQDGFHKFMKFRMNCAMKQYSAFIGQYSEYHGDFKFQRLPGGDHSAVGDCRATLEVIKKMAMAD